MSDTGLAPTRRALVAQVGMLALAGSTLPAAAASDGELLRLGELFEAAWKQERSSSEALDVGCTNDTLESHRDAYDRVADLVREIETLPATTLRGLIVKARACSWTHDGEPVEPDFFAFNGSPTTDQRLGAAILRDLLAIAGPAPWST